MVTMEQRWVVGGKVGEGMDGRWMAMVDGRKGGG